MEQVSPRAIRRQEHGWPPLKVPAPEVAAAVGWLRSPAGHYFAYY
jgi:hypothetical protein